MVGVLMLRLGQRLHRAGKIIQELRRLNVSFESIVLRWRNFDRAFYCRRYPEVIAAGMHPFLHYILHGAPEGRKPCASFDPRYYLAGSRPAQARGGDPFFDYLKYGRKEGASSHPLVDGRIKTGGIAAGSLFVCNPDDSREAD